VAGFRGFLLNIPPQAHDKIVNCSSVGIFVQIPNVLQDGFAGHRLTAVAYQVAQQFRFHQRQLKDLATAAELQINEINGAIVKLKKV
jgi:hypothetical protein